MVSSIWQGAAGAAAVWSVRRWTAKGRTTPAAATAGGQSFYQAYYAIFTGICYSRQAYADTSSASYWASSCAGLIAQCDACAGKAHTCEKIKKPTSLRHDRVGTISRKASTRESIVLACFVQRGFGVKSGNSHVSLPNVSSSYRSTYGEYFLARYGHGPVASTLTKNFSVTPFLRPS
jgi:hypothetical protein